MPAFLAKKYYCHTCKKGCTRRDKHKCPDKCLSCFKTEHDTGDKITWTNATEHFSVKSATTSIFRSVLTI